jgi:hypothetical protein
MPYSSGDDKNVLVEKKSYKGEGDVLWIPLFLPPFCKRKRQEKKLNIATSNQTRLPAELKHINKRRKRN